MLRVRRYTKPWRAKIILLRKLDSQRGEKSHNFGFGEDNKRPPMSEVAMGIKGYKDGHILVGRKGRTDKEGREAG